MRVCLVAYSFYEIDSRILQYAKALRARGDAVDVIALRLKGQPAYQTLDGVNVYRIQERIVNERGPLSYLVRIMQFLLHSSVVLVRRHLEYAYDLVHVHSVPDFLVFAAMPLRITGVPVILDIHDILPELYASKFSVSSDSLLFRLLVLVEKLSAAAVDHVLIANHLWRERLISRSVKPDKCTVICNYPDPNHFYVRPRTRQDGKFLITYPGSLNPHQGLDIALKGFARVAKRIPEAEFHIYGEGPTKGDLIQLTRELGLSDKVQFKPWAPVKEIASVMADTDLAVVPKRASSQFGNEAASTKILEFMSLGVPIVVSRTRVDMYYHNESRVKFFESENEADLADCIVEVWRNQPLREQLVTNALRHVREHNWETRREEYLKIVDSLCRKRPLRNVALTSHKRQKEVRPDIQ